MLKCWLQPELEDKVPPYATHQVGAAGFVLDGQGRLLVVQELRDGPAGARLPSGTWKLPGGLVDRGGGTAYSGVGAGADARCRDSEGSGAGSLSSADNG